MLPLIGAAARITESNGLANASVAFETVTFDVKRLARSCDSVDMAGVRAAEGAIFCVEKANGSEAGVCGAICEVGTLVENPNKSCSAAKCALGVGVPATGAIFAEVGLNALCMALNGVAILMAVSFTYC